MVDVVSTVSNLQTNAASSSKSLADNFDTFITLLTAQLQNQDPLEPVDSTEFTNQLVQFSSVEQQIETNSALADLITLTANSQAASLSGYLGKTVEVQSATAELSGEDGIDWLYTLPEGVESVTLSVQSADGRIVYSEKVGDTSVGNHDFTWDGTMNNGQTASDGVYSLLIGATNQNETAVSVAPRVRTEVTGIDLSLGVTALATNSGIYDFASVLRVTGAN
jgi:flagellar basal-body rod modification protein FlgD